MKIKCKKCGYTEETNKDLWIKILGGALPTGGVAMLVYKDEILKWISSHYKSPKCNNNDWDLVS